MITQMLRLLVSLLPWPFRRIALVYLFDYKIHPSARIGYSWVFPKHLSMESGSRIGHLNVIVNLDSVKLGERASISRGNWITGFPTGTASDHFAHQVDRVASLHLAKHSAITRGHHIDCTAQIDIGKFSTIAGYSSQLLTHSIDVRENRQHSKPISIGDYCFVGTNVVILGGSKLPNYSVLGAKSLLQREFDEDYSLYAGVPALLKAKLNGSAKYFCRSEGFVI